MKIWLRIVFGIIIILLLLVVRLLFNAGVFTKINAHFNGSISEINGFEGGEDITIDQSNGYAYISSNDFSLKKENVGAIYKLNLNEKHPKPQLLSHNLPFDFHPHGISLFSAADGQKKLFVVNHRKAGNFIEIFDVQDSIVIHRESIADLLIISPNDVLAVGEREFYVTNDHNEALSSWRGKKDLMQIPMGNVIYFDGKKTKIVAEGFLYANGINMANDGKKVFVAATSGGEIKVFDRNLANGTLIKSDEIAIHGADNIEIDPENNLWVGCHVNLLAFLSHSKNQAKLSPSEIIKIVYSGKGKAKSYSIYQNNGQPISGSSVATVYKNRLLVGSVYEDKLLLGEMK